MYTDNNEHFSSNSAYKNLKGWRMTDNGRQMIRKAFGSDVLKKV